MSNSSIFTCANKDVVAVVDGDPVDDLSLTINSSRFNVSLNSNLV